MESPKTCWCGEPVQKSDVESTTTEEVYRCTKGHRLSKQSILRQAAGLVSFVTLGIFLGDVIT
jgi:hypothetical protein